MPHVPDATTKDAFDLHPRPWLALAGLPVPPTDAGLTVVDTSTPTVARTADKLVRVDDGVAPYLAHVESQTSRDVDFDRRVLRCDGWAGDAYGLPVRSVAFLFRRRAGGDPDHSRVNGPAVRGGSRGGDHGLVCRRGGPAGPVDGAEPAKRTDRLLTADGWNAPLGG